MTEENNQDTTLAISKSSSGIRVQIDGTHVEEFVNEYKTLVIDSDNLSWNLEDEDFEIDEDSSLAAFRIISKYFIAHRSKGFVALYVMALEIDIGSIQLDFSPESLSEDGFPKFLWKYNDSNVGFYGEGGWKGVRTY